MADSSAVTLWDRQDGEDTSIALLSDRQVGTRDVVGPGRLLHQAYSVAGRVVEKGLGRAAHGFGLGPDATSSRIEEAFGDDPSTKQSRLDGMYDSFQQRTTTQHAEFVRALMKDCRKLLEYAPPSQSPATQIQTFKRIIVLTMRYPGLRRMFLRSPDIRKVEGSPEAICALWKSTEYAYDKKERFALEFAAHCLARINPNIELEGIRPSELGCISGEYGLGVVDRLVVRYCDEGSGFPRLIAIRYLAGILGLPAFWSEAYHVQKHTMDKLCRQTYHLIEDVNPESVNAKDIVRLASLDPDGVDALAGAILAGGKSWIQREPRIEGLGSDYWLPNFIKLIRTLRGLILTDLLPISSEQAAENWEALLTDTTDQLPISEVDCQFEDLYTFVNGSSRSNWQPFAGESSIGGTGVFVNESSRSTWRPATVAGGSLPRSGGGVPVNGRGYSSRSRLSRFFPGHVEATQSDWRPSDFADELLNTDTGSPSLLKAIAVAFRATFFRTTSNVEKEATPSGSQTGGDVNREDHHSPETLPATVTATLAEETEEDDSIPNRPLSPLEYTSDVTETSVLGPTVQEVVDSDRENNRLPETQDVVEVNETSRPAGVANSFDETGEGNLSQVVDVPLEVLHDEDTSGRNARPPFPWSVQLDGNGNVLSNESISQAITAGHVNSARRNEFRGEVMGYINRAQNGGPAIAYSETTYLRYNDSIQKSQVPSSKEDTFEDESESSDDGHVHRYGDIYNFVKRARDANVTRVGTSRIERQRTQNRAGQQEQSLTVDMEALTKEYAHLSPDMIQFIDSLARQ